MSFWAASRDCQLCLLRKLATRSINIYFCKRCVDWFSLSMEVWIKNGALRNNCLYHALKNSCSKRNYLCEMCPNTEYFLSVFFRIRTEYFVSLRIQSECRKIHTRKYSVFGHISRSETICDWITFLLKEEFYFKCFTVNFAKYFKTSSH